MKWWASPWRTCRPSPVTSRRQVKYATDWTAKQACYDALGVVPVVVEPADVHDKRHLAERMGEVARLLGCAPPPIPPGSTRCTRAKGSWTVDALVQAVEEVAGTTGKLPTYAALSAAGYGHAAVMLRRPGMRARVAEALALKDPNRKDLWTRERVVTELAAWVRHHGHYPTGTELLKAGLGTLCSARDRLWAGAQGELREAVSRSAGLVRIPTIAAIDSDRNQPPVPIEASRAFR